jgi:hypothetical protein
MASVTDSVPEVSQRQLFSARASVSWRSVRAIIFGVVAAPGTALRQAHAAARIELLLPLIVVSIEAAAHWECDFSRSVSSVEMLLPVRSCFSR